MKETDMTITETSSMIHGFALPAERGMRLTMMITNIARSVGRR